MNLVDFKVADFIAETASKSPAPGGGSVSALAGCLGAALAQMVIRLTDGKKAFLALPESTQKEITESLTALEKKQAELLHLIDEDTKAFNSFMDALSLPKSTDEEKAKRSEAMKNASILSMNVPLKTARVCFDVLQKLKTLAMYGNKNAVSDAGVAALMGEAGLYGAVLNVKINLMGFDDGDKKTKLIKECDELIKNSAAIRKDILEIVNSKIS